MEAPRYDKARQVNGKAEIREAAQMDERAEWPVKRAIEGTFGGSISFELDSNLTF